MSRSVVDCVLLVVVGPGGAVPHPRHLAVGGGVSVVVLDDQEPEPVPVGEQVWGGQLVAARTNTGLERVGACLVCSETSGLDATLQLCAETLEERLVVLFVGERIEGMQGARSVAAAGGLVWATPQVSLAGCPVERVLDLEDVAREVARYVQIFDVGAVSEQTAVWSAIGDAVADQGLDLTRYRSQRVAQCVERRRYLQGGSTLEDYVRLLVEERCERKQLGRALLGPVTRFFRDPSVWEALATQVLQTRIAALDPGEDLRCWVAGCGTGEESYTLAMIAIETARSMGRHCTVRVHATDLHAESLDIASAGWYPATATARLSPQRLERWFVSDRGGHRVVEEIRTAVVFSRHDVTRDAPLTRMDVVCCRNVLALLRPAAQQPTLAMLHGALREDGCLVLGRGETPSTLEPAFEEVEASQGLYRKVPAPLTRVAPGAMIMTPRRRPDPLLDVEEGVFGDDLKRRRGVCLFLSPAGRVLRVLGDPVGVLSPQPGDVDATLGALMEPRLAVLVAAAVRQCRQTHEDVELSGVCTDAGSVDVWARCHEDAAGEHRFLSVILTANTRMEEAPPELHAARERLFAGVDELRGTAASASACATELLSAKEELGALREQLSGVERELEAVEREAMVMQAELSATGATIDAVLSTTELGVLMVDADHRIRRFSPASARLLGLSAASIGTALGDVDHGWEAVCLVADARAALRSRRSTQEVVRRSGLSLSKRVTPLGLDGELDRGVLFTFMPLPQDESLVQEVVAQRARLSAVCGQPMGVWAWDGTQLTVEGDETGAASQDKVVDQLRGMRRDAHVLDVLTWDGAHELRWVGTVDPSTPRAVGVVMASAMELGANPEPLDR